MKIGYARVSTRRQNVDLQCEALRQAGCDLIFSEWATGATKARRGLVAAIASCNAGDELVIWKLDRLGRDLFELLELAKVLKRRGVLLRVLSGLAAVADIDSAEGRVVFAMFAAFAELERAIGRDRARSNNIRCICRKTKDANYPTGQRRVERQASDSARTKLGRRQLKTCVQPPSQLMGL